VYHFQAVSECFVYLLTAVNCNFAGMKTQVLNIWNSIICMLLKPPSSVLHTSRPFCMLNSGVMVTGKFLLLDCLKVMEHTQSDNYLM
jgi:hypothetical protein